MATVFVVEDDPELREALTYLLEYHGYRVDGAANGREALDYLRRETAPCVILLDLMMPVMDGWEFREAQLGDPALASIPTVVVSAFSRRDEAAERIRANAFLAKPIDPEALLATVGRYC